MAAYIRPQFSVEQRNFIAMSFERNKHQYTKIQLVQEEFKLLARNLKNVIIDKFTYRAVRKSIKLFSRADF